MDRFEPIEAVIARGYSGANLFQHRSCETFIAETLRNPKAIKEYLSHWLKEEATLNEHNLMCIADALRQHGVAVDHVGYQLKMLARVWLLTLPDQPEVFTAEYWAHVYSEER